jgi:molybdate transport system substrate-binding protein
MAGVLVLLALGGCGGGTKQVEGDITVFAATSLTGAFTDIGKAFEKANPGSKVTFNFAASSALAQQIDEGNRPDVFASADTKHMGQRRAEVFARNRLVIVTEPGNTHHIQRLADLTHTGVISLCGAEVPCGAYAAQALSKAGVTLDESKVTRGPNSAATVAAVSDGDAVAAVVYATDAKAAGPHVNTITIPAGENVVADYPIAAVRRSSKARAFVDFVLGDEGQRILRRYGFLPPA